MSNKVRISVGITPKQKQVLSRIAHVRSVSVSRVAGEIIEASEEALERLCLILEAADEASASFRAGSRNMALSVADDIQGLYDEAMQKLTDIPVPEPSKKH